MSPAAKSIYIASPEGETGKSTIALGILHRLAALVPRVGVFRPIVRRDSRDYILELLLTQCPTPAGAPDGDPGLSYQDCVGVTYPRLHEDPDAAIADIVARYHALADRCDAMVIVGSDYTDVASPTELSVNARIAAMETAQDPQRRCRLRAPGLHRCKGPGFR